MKLKMGFPVKNFIMGTTVKTIVKDMGNDFLGEQRVNCCRNG